MTVGMQKDRFAAVDGLRMVAILWVAIYHYAVFWTPAGKGENLVPYGDALSWIPLAAVGGLGVSLFFIISGFVIMLSLERCSDFRTFAMLRMLRLWPTLLVCGSLTFLVTSMFGPPELLRSLPEYLLSMVFLPPQHAGRAFGMTDLQWLDGAYWSLWVEVRFYAVAAVIFFALRRQFLLGWTVFAGASAILHLFVFPQDHMILGLLFSENQPFFTMGIALAVWRSSGRAPVPVAMFAVAVGQAFVYATPGLSTYAGLAIVCALGAFVILSVHRIPILTARPVVRAGQASYAYYLLHQNIGLALLATFAPNGIVGGILTMIAIQLALLVLSIWFTEKLEEPLRWRMRSLLSRQPASTA